VDNRLDAIAPNSGQCRRGAADRRFYEPRRAAEAFAVLKPDVERPIAAVMRTVWNIIPYTTITTLLATPLKYRRTECRLFATTQLR
jgi:hypothetical protein